MNPINQQLAIQEKLREFVAERDWARFHDPKNLAMAIASEAGELLAELRWTTNMDSDGFVRSPAHRANIENEIADIAITLLLFCDRAGIDLMSAVERKIDLNRSKYPADVTRGVPERPGDPENGPPANDLAP